MGSIRKRNDSGLLFFDFRFQSRRCREQTLLEDTVNNRRKLEKVLKKIEAEIKASCFDYASYFPTSKNLKYFYSISNVNKIKVLNANEINSDNIEQDFPIFDDFTDTWVSENEVAWRRSHRRTQMDIINGHLKPIFRDKVVNQITKPDILAFRSSLAKVPGRKNATLSHKRINSIMAPLRQILNEAADRYEFNTPYRNIKPLKVPKSDVEPFTFADVNRFIECIRSDFKDYYTVRFFTGLRTGEIDGLKWKYIDFDRRLILVRETIVAGETDYTKTDGSQRDIQMSQIVYDALKSQKKITEHNSEYVFCTKEGNPFDHSNITKRVWYPMLQYLGLKKRRPYQSRHTTATLWLASGENPEWIARQMGHTNTEMLFKVYSRFVPNLTRQDGSAFESMLSNCITNKNGES